MLLARLGHAKSRKGPVGEVGRRGEGRDQCRMSRAGSVDELRIRSCKLVVVVNREDGRVVVDSFVVKG